jgi:hypothetical protein
LLKIIEKRKQTPTTSQLMEFQIVWSPQWENLPEKEKR